MKCQCPSGAHGHRPGHCASGATTETYCPRCHAAKAKEDAANPQARRGADTRPHAGPSDSVTNTSSASLGG